MDDARLAVVRMWFKKAESDFRTIENNLKSEAPPTDAVCFHAQQAIEKYLKGALIYFGGQVTKTHDLVNLTTSLSTHVPDLGNLEEQLDNISRYGVEVRYPDVAFTDPTL
jgi:HEPN domain-containing protein